VGEVEEFVAADVFQLLAAFFELLIEFEGALGHVGVSFFRAAGEEEVFAAGEAGVAVVVVEAKAEEEGFLFAFIGHKVV